MAHDDGLVVRTGPLTPAEVAERAAFRAEVLGAFGGTPQDLAAVRPEPAYERVRAAAEADAEFADQAVRVRREQLAAADDGSVHREFTVPMAREVGCPMCPGYDPLDGRTPVCACGFDWGYAGCETCAAPMLTCAAGGDTPCCGDCYHPAA